MHIEEALVRVFLKRATEFCDIYLLAKKTKDDEVIENLHRRIKTLEKKLIAKKKRSKKKK